MPKEIVRDRFIDDGLAEGSFYTHVGWDKVRGAVQVATVAPNRPLVQGASTAEYNGWFVELDRAGINDLIRALRKARDQAFGADA